MATSIPTPFTVLELEALRHLPQSQIHDVKAWLKDSNIEFAWSPDDGPKLCLEFNSKADAAVFLTRWQGAMHAASGRDLMDAAIALDLRQPKDDPS